MYKVDTTDLFQEETHMKKKLLIGLLLLSLSVPMMWDCGVSSDAEVIDLGDGLAVPGFIDGYAHGHEGDVTNLYEVNLYGATTVKAYQKRLKDFIKNNPDREFIFGTGWENGYMPSNGNYAALLNEVSKDLPIVLVSQEHHSYWTNSKAMGMMKVDADTKDIKGGVITRDKDENPTGIFRENANSLAKTIIPDYTVEEFKHKPD